MYIKKKIFEQDQALFKTVDRLPRDLKLKKNYKKSRKVRE